jgi:hypothetical protein
MHFRQAHPHLENQMVKRAIPQHSERTFATQPLSPGSYHTS